MKRPSSLFLATALASILFLASACTHSSDSTTTDTSAAGAAATASAGSQGAMGSGGAMSGGGGGYGGSGGRSGAGRMMGKILLSLNLTDDQKAKIKGIRNAAIAKNKAIPQTDPNRRDEMRANMAAMSTQIDAVLTPAQRVTFHAKLDAMRAKYRQQQGQVQQPSQQSSP